MINYLDPNFELSPVHLPASHRYFKARKGWAPKAIDVSIITPYFNTEELFQETVVSIFQQTLQNWEWVIVDDGSTDAGALERLASLTGGDARIKVIRQENAGPGAARNTAFANSAGRYVCLLDSDDLIEPTYLEKCVWFLDSNPEFAFCNSYSAVFGEQQYLWTTGFERNKEHLNANSGPPISVIRREAFAESGGFDASIRFGHEDWDFWLAMAKAGHWGHTIKEFLQWYRKRGTGRFEQIMRSGSINDEFEKLMRTKYAGLEASFPNPQRRHALPYETLQAKWTVDNPLEANSNGRRILVLLPWMVIGGADRVNLDLIEGLVGRGHQVTICATLEADHRWACKFTELTPDVFVLPSFLHVGDYPRFLAYIIDSRQIDTVVVTGSTVGYQLLPFLRAVAPKTAFVDLSHVEELHWLNGGHPRFGAGYQDALDMNIVTTGHLARWMEGRGADISRIRVLYTGVRPPALHRAGEDRAAVRLRYGVADDTPVIVFAGRICEQKRPALLARILKDARDSGLTFQTLIIGEGELRPAFEGLVDEYGLRDRVQMLGALGHDKWLEALVGSDILLMPSQYEGISIALLESMAAGVVPVVARVGGQPEIVADNAGYLIAHGEGESALYVDALQRLIGGGGELVAKSAVCQSLMATTFSWQKTISDFESIISEAHARIVKRGCQFTAPMGLELASLALENKRLGDAVDWLWHQSNGGKKVDTSAQGPLISSDIAPVVRLAVLLCRTRMGRVLLGNETLKAAGRRLIARLDR
jgi:glycosyltransferase involved in cell wall biosynthesis